MEPLTTTAIAAALGVGLRELANHLAQKTLLDPVLDPVAENLRGYLPQLHNADDRALQEAVEIGLTAAGAPLNQDQNEEQDDDGVTRWLKNVSLDRLAAPGNDALRRQMARAIVGFTDPAAPPPADLVIALGWPRSQTPQLARLLATLRMQLATLDPWQALIAYANDAEQLGALRAVLEKLARLDTLFVQTAAGDALRVAVVQHEMTADEAAALEERYRDDLVRDLRHHEFRGIAQTRNLIRLPLADIYLELGLLTLGSESERRKAQEHLLTLDQAERMHEEERRLDARVTDALARAPRLVILGEPGAGKTTSLHFIALMLAHGFGAARLELDAPYIPIRARLADYARARAETSNLSLDNFLLRAIEQEYPHPRLGEFLRLALERGACLVLLDGLDEVGEDPVEGESLRSQVVQQVQRFGDRWCDDAEGDDTAARANRLIVTSRIEGYWDAPLRAAQHVQLSPLRPPQEIEDFLQRWYTAHEQAHDPQLSTEETSARAAARVHDLLPSILETPSVRRLATNPLLLTILALIHETVGRLPHRRVELYDVCAQTLIDSWRRAQTGMSSALLADLGPNQIIRVMAPLAYWLHEENPGGTASFDAWRARLLQILEEEGFEEEAAELVERFLHHARYSAGLLAERGLGQFGFFHLTFEEYLAARQIARQRVEERRAMIGQHWEDPRWREVILLAAGQLGIIEAKTDDVSDFLVDLLEMEPQDPENAGRQIVLAGRALADIGRRNVTPVTRRWVMEMLRETMQDLDPESKQPHDPPRLPVRTRHAAGEVLDELGWLPRDLHAWVRCPGCADDAGDSLRDLLVMKYPVTNAQFAHFVQSDGYTNPAHWGGAESAGWRWRMEEHGSYRGDGPVTQPRYWQDARFGRERRGYPVVGVSWYEAAAFANWLTALLQRMRDGADVDAAPRALVADLVAAGATQVRLPMETEWERVAGGAADAERYPWDPPDGPATQDESAILARANTSEADLGGPSPVGMYPLGASQPYDLMDLAGNVWEWTGSWYDERRNRRVLRGGSWYLNRQNARCAVRVYDNPHSSSDDFGLRLVSPIGSDC